MLLFVYGTLKCGQRNHDLLLSARFLGEARTRPVYRLYDLGPYPALVKVNPGESILGELYDVPEHRLLELDEFEGSPSLYQRATVALLDIADEVQAYFYQRPIPPGCPASTHWPLETK